MEVVPTSDGEDDDGVIWFRCPQCQGFLPKLSGAGLQADKEPQTDKKPQADKEPQTDTREKADSPETTAPAGTSAAEPEHGPETGHSDSSTSAEKTAGLPWDSPADMMKARRNAGDPESLPELDELSGGDTAQPASEKQKSEQPDEPAEPIHEYAAMLEAKDQSEPSPYRPWETYEVGQCIHHQAWEDCGVVVAKEKLPGGRQVIKCYFEEAGVVRLIEKAPR